MKCHICNMPDTKVTDSRATDENSIIRRRRECIKCKARFTTYEVMEFVPVYVIKSNGSRQAFDPQKVKMGIIKASEKRQITIDTIDKIVGEIEREISNSLVKEIDAKHIGEMIMDKLKLIDQVAYVRFASVYRQFADVTTFVDFIGELDSKSKNSKSKKIKTTT